MKRYLVYDAACSACTQIARGIEGIAGSRLEAIRITDDEAKALLDRAYPGGWRRAPYLVSVKGGGQIRASTGVGAVIRLGWLLGPRKGFRTWALARKSGVSVTRMAAVDSSSWSRRTLLKFLGALGATAALVALRPVRPAAACNCGIDCPCPQWDEVYFGHTCTWSCGGYSAYDYVYQHYTCGDYCGLHLHPQCCDCCVP